MSQSTSPDETQIRNLAYFLWEQDGRPHGRDHEYWQRALVALAEAAAPDMPVESPAGPELRRPSAIKAIRARRASRPKPPPRFRSEASRAAKKR